MANELARAGERALTYGASGALIGSAIPVIGTALGAGIGAAYGGISGWLSASQENEQLAAAENQATQAIEDARKALEDADAARASAINEFIRQQEASLRQIRERRTQLASQISEAQTRGLAAEERQLSQGFTSQEDALRRQEDTLAAGRLAQQGALTEQRGGLEEIYKARLGGLTGQEQRLADILRLQQEGITSREALVGDEEAAARRVMGPGGLLERQRQSNALAQARAMQRARVGGPAARAAVMGQFATQGAELGMRAQQDLMAAQDRARQARAGLLSERTAAAIAQQQGLGDIIDRRVEALAGRVSGMGNLASQRGQLESQYQTNLGSLYGERGNLALQRAQTMAGLTGRRTAAEEARLRAMADADIEQEEGLLSGRRQYYTDVADMASRRGERQAGVYRDTSDVGMATRGRALELDAAESARNVGLLQSGMGILAANPKMLSNNLLPNWMSSGGGSGSGAGGAYASGGRMSAPSNLGSPRRGLGSTQYQDGGLY